MTTIISQYGLTKLLRVTIPALLLIYPMAIMLVVLQLVRNKLPSIRLSYYTTIFVTVCFSLIDSSEKLGYVAGRVTSNHDSFPALFTRACVACALIMYFSAFHDIRENHFKIIKMPIMICRHFLY